MTARLLTFAAALALLVSVVPAPASDEADLADVLAGSGEHSIFVIAVQESGLAAVLKGKGPMTVFAPTDAAFDKLGDDQIRAIGKNKDQLKRVVLAHVVSGQQLSSKDLAGRDGQELNGFKIGKSKDALTIGGAKIVKADIAAANGVVHAIDTVLIPAN